MNDCMKPQLERVKQLVMKQLTGQLTAAEERELERLVQTDSRGRRLAGRLLSPEFLSKAVLDHNKQAQAASWQSLYERMGYTGGVLGRFRRIRRWMVAAAAVLFLLLGWQVWRYQERDAAKVIYPGITQAEICWPDGQQFTYTSDMLNGKFSLASDTEAKDTVSQGFVSPDLYTRVVVPLGSEYRIGLDDGTQIHLNAGSTLTVPSNFSAHNRRINLSGEAYLEVSKDSLHPFTISTGKADIRVLGTKLNVRCYEDEPQLDVVLESGRVNVRTAGQEISLPVGFKATVDADGHVNTCLADVYAETAWHQGRFVFDNQSMEKIMHELGRWYDVQASFSSDEARKVRFTLDIDRYGTFNQFLDMIRLTGEMDIRLKGNQVLISMKEHSNKHN